MTSAAEQTIEPIEPDVRAQWVESCQREVERQSFVKMNMDAIDAIIDAMMQVDTSNYWRPYVSPVDDADPDLDKLAYEMALATAQNGGFITAIDDKVAVKWESAKGSGTDRMISVLNQLRERNAKGESGMPEPENGRPFEVVRSRIDAVFLLNDVPKSAARLGIFEQLGTLNSRNFIVNLVKNCFDGKRYNFTCEHVDQLAKEFPDSFGGDEPFNKKATLYFLLMGRALQDLGKEVKVDTLVPMEYRILQIFTVYGAIEMTKDLSEAIASKTPLPRGSKQFRALRSAGVILAEEILRRMKLTDPNASAQDVDARLYLLSKQRPYKVRSQGTEHAYVDTIKL